MSAEVTDQNPQAPGAAIPSSATNRFPQSPRTATSSHATQPNASAERGFSFRAALVFSMSVLVVLTGVSIIFIASAGARSGTAELANALFRQTSEHAVTATQDFFQRAVPISQMLANLSNLGLATTEPDLLARQLTAVLSANPGISWVSYSSEAGAFVGAYRTADGILRVNQSHILGGRTAMVEYNVKPDGSWEIFRREEDSGYDPRKRPFYQRAREAHQLVWLPPYIFYEQSLPGVTCANPLYDAAGRLQGVVTVDFDLNTLSQFVQKQTISARSRLFILTGDGILVAHPDFRVKVQPGHRDQGALTHMEDFNDDAMKAFYAQLGPRDRVASRGDQGRQFEFRYAGMPYYARTTAFSIDGSGGLVWIVGALAPQSDFLASVHRTEVLAVGASGAALLIAVALATFMARRVSGPILSLASLMRAVGAGDLSAQANLRGSREFRQLSATLNHMITDLRDRMRMRTAMGVAMEVQQRLLPTAPPNIPGLEVAGFSLYCDETGGDYFDYLYDPSNPANLLVAIGDVTGHGIGAALLMASARAILRSHATTCGELGALLMHINDHLTADMRASRFMTLLLWRIDSQKRTVCWASAGHDPAILYDPATGSFDQHGPGGVPVGIIEDATYTEQRLGPLSRGQIIVLGTDGIWETANPAREQYGKDRLRECIRAHANEPAESIASAVRDSLRKFRQTERQRDDVTLVVIKLLKTKEP